jgi:hypothetical protein
MATRSYLEWLFVKGLCDEVAGVNGIGDQDEESGDGKFRGGWLITRMKDEGEVVTCLLESVLDKGKSSI